MRNNSIIFANHLGDELGVYEEHKKFLHYCTY